jgi:hypothetical protein
LTGAVPVQVVVARWPGGKKPARLSPKKVGISMGVGTAGAARNG